MSGEAPSLLDVLGSMGPALASALSVLFFAVAVDHFREQRRVAGRLARFGLAPADDMASAPSGTDLLRRVGERLAMHVPPDQLQRLRLELVRAGVADRLNAEEFFGLRAFAVVAGLALGLTLGGLLALFVGPLALVLAALGAVRGYAAPARAVARLIDQRRDTIERLLPDAVDVLVVSLEAGISFDMAVGSLCERANNQLVVELRRYLSDRRLGSSRRDALDGLVERTQSASLRRLASAVIQAEELGTGLAAALRGQSQALRSSRRLRAEELARQAPVKLMFPMVLFILPVLFIVIIGPAMIGALAIFSK